MSALWLWTIAAPAFRQRTASAAISDGVRGTCGFRSGVVAPLIAASMMTGVAMRPLSPVAKGREALLYCAAMDIETADHLLTTTRSVRKRLDLGRPVPADLIERAIELALPAPAASDPQG